MATKTETTETSQASTVTETVQTTSSGSQQQCHNHELPKALEGIRVLDLTRVLAGPYCTMMLGDLGADVIKIEKPGVGDDTRLWGPPFVGGQSCYFLSVNRNKKSVCVDLKTKTGQKIVTQLAAESDIFVENYLPGKLQSLGLDYETLKSVNPRLIYCSITGYGRTGPYATRAGYDVIAASIGGLLHITGPENGEPCKPGVALTDISTGLHAYGSIMAALYKRERTGKGQLIEANLLSTQVASLVNLASNYLNAGKEAQRWGTAHESIVPYQSFATSDGFLTIGAGNNKQYKEFCRAIGRKDLLRFATNKERVQHRTELVEEIKNALRGRATEEWLETFTGCSFTYGPINSLAKVFEDPQVCHSGIVQEVEHPTAGNVKLVGPPVRFGEMSNEIRSHPPLLGQHTDIVLQEVLHYSASDINTLRKEKIIA